MKRRLELTKGKVSIHVFRTKRIVRPRPGLENIVIEYGHLEH